MARHEELFIAVITVLVCLVQESKADGNIPKPQITQTPVASVIYRNEKITLNCSVPWNSLGLDYIWYKDATLFNSNQTYTIDSADPSPNGEYKCQVKRDNDTSELSDPLTLSVVELPQPNLVLWTKVYPAEVVHLSCNIEPSSSDWTYQLHRNGRKIGSTNYSSFSMSSLQTGRHTCVGVHKQRGVKTNTSNGVDLTVYGSSPKPLLTQDSASASVLYTKEEVTLQCKITDNSEGWTYLWHKGQHKTLMTITGSPFTLSSVVPADSGQYWCQAERAGFKSEYSDSLSLEIKEPPQPDLSLQPPWAKVFPSEVVIFNCSIQSSSNDWSYEWDKDGLNQTRTIKNRFKIKSVAEKDSGSYTCRGIHKSLKKVTTAHSSGITIYVYDEKAVPTLSQHPNDTSVYVEEQVTFMCEVEIDSTGWQYQWFKKNLQGPIPNTDPTATNYTIKSASAKHEDEFWCRAQRGVYKSEPSRPIQIQVLSRPETVLTLESDLADILTVDSITLRCDVQVKDFEWNYTWYRDGNEMADISADIHVKATKETYQSEYTCRGARLQRPTYSALSEAFIANNLVLKRKILLAISGGLVVGILLIVLGCMILKVTRKPVKESKTEPDLFFTMAELKTRADIGSTADLCPAESVDKLRTTVKESQGDEETDGFISFKA